MFDKIKAAWGHMLVRQLSYGLSLAFAGILMGYSGFYFGVVCGMAGSFLEAMLHD